MSLFLLLGKRGFDFLNLIFKNIYIINFLKNNINTSNSIFLIKNKINNISSLNMLFYNFYNKSKFYFILYKNSWSVNFNYFFKRISHLIFNIFLFKIDSFFFLNKLIYNDDSITLNSNLDSDVDFKFFRKKNYKKIIFYMSIDFRTLNHFLLRSFFVIGVFNFKNNDIQPSLILPYEVLNYSTIYAYLNYFVYIKFFFYRFNLNNYKYLYIYFNFIKKKLTL